jgi:hypothetical protein
MFSRLKFLKNSKKKKKKKKKKKERKEKENTIRIKFNRNILLERNQK